MFRGLKLSRKLALGFMLILLLSTAVTMVGIVSMGRIASSTLDLYDHPYMVSTSVLAMKGNVIAIDREMKEIIRATNRDTILKYGEQINEFEQDILKSIELVYERFLGDHALIDAVLEAITDWKPIRDEIIRLQRVGRYVEAATMATDINMPQVELIEIEIQQVLEQAQALAADYVEAAQQDANRARTVVIFFLAASYVVALIITLVVTRGITVPVNRLLGFTQEIAQGNLSVATIQFKNRDEVGALAEAMNKMKLGLHDMVLSVTKAVSLAGSSANQMSAAAQETSASVEELASTANHFAGAVDRLSSNAQDMADLANKTNDLSAQGEQEIQQTIRIMSEIETLVGTLATDIRNLNQQSEQIGEIVTLITGIADQTNLLALNAAIEAARAGEQGRGFAVVADEVRQLAEQSARAAGEITEVVHQIRDSALMNVQHAEAGTTKVQDGVAIVSATGQMFGEIRAIIAELMTDISTVASASQELAAGAEEMGATTEEQSASVQQMASSTAEMAEITHQIEAEMEQFKL